MRDFKKVEIDGEIYLYPVPVIKNNKYLIYCGSEIVAEKILSEILHHQIIHPDEAQHEFVKVRLHSDGRTPIFAHKTTENNF